LIRHISTAMSALRPPLLPAHALRRVTHIARLDGLGVLTIAGLFALASALLRDEVGTVIGLVVAGAGAIELHGVALLRHGAERGMRWLVGSQLLLLVVVLGYVVLRLWHVDITMMRPLLSDQQQKVIVESGLSVDQFLRLIYKTTYILVGVATLLYQGGLTIYYQRRRTAVAAALREFAS
jgi:hypothetical protein